MTAAPSTAVFFTGTPTRVGPLLPNGEPLLLDPVANWELRRAAWLSRRQPQPRAAREPAFAARLEALQAMLRPPATTSPPPFGTTTSASGSTTGGKGKAVEEMRAEDEPDGGEVISSRERGDDELERAMESVLAAFRQGRPLKDPLPLSLVTSLLYASWQTDGTIPPEFLKTTTSPPSYTPISAFPLVPNHQQHPGFGTVPPPVQRVVIGGEENGKKKDPLKGSRWRTEKEIASGSDVI